ncbi:hypothetical protein AG1IA_03913 [Rhizoctonia solani AG-1 IA]|uniref:Uncharacterized protein n=1 Tax=Thanatephorus cucumeris (strain AG1-IA) TaxID=983506 RepID=L8WZ10_THACA|nr:hypothetical protein AG1IA_03913 [Rhizoctonia solani AG-1 IA]
MIIVNDMCVFMCMAVVSMWLSNTYKQQAYTLVTQSSALSRYPKYIVIST